MRSLNLTPFADFSRNNSREILDNLIVFIPFGLLLSASFKQATFRRKLAFISMFSLAVEVVQYVLAIGVADITDVIANTLGGFLGLTLYGLGKKYGDSKKLDRFVVIMNTTLFILFMLLRFFVFKVRY
jgi:glycopeptide antibiotics resistance protein